jgi:hypothetical protein
VAFNDMRTLAERELGATHFDEVRLIPDTAELERCFSGRLFFGCEAEDPGTAWGFDRRMRPRLNAMFGSDIGHFDVAVMSGVLGEAWELVEDGLLSVEDFRDFTFTSAVRLHGGANPAFFAGTSVDGAALELIDSDARSSLPAGHAGR